MNIFWYVAPCSLLEVYRRFKGVCCLQNDRPDDRGKLDFDGASILWTIDQEAANTSETAVNFY
jgi:hypothetical protein